MLKITANHPKESLAKWVAMSNGAIVSMVGQIAPEEVMNFESTADGDTSLIMIRVEGFGPEPDLQRIAVAAFQKSFGNFGVVLTDEHGRRFEEFRRAIELPPQSINA